MKQQMAPNIPTTTKSCQMGLTNLLQAAKDENTCARYLIHTKDVQQVHDRFHQWAGNLGALQPFESALSLEHRLREAPIIRQSILSSLMDLDSSIQNATEIALGLRQNRSTALPMPESDENLSEYDISSSESGTSSSSSLGERNALAPTSELQELMLAIRTGLDSLFKTSVFIRQFASREKRSRAVGTKPFDSRADIIYVNDRYPLLSKHSTLAARLGEANARRRQYFKYRRDHDQRLATVHNENKPIKSIVQATSVVNPPELARTELTVETKPSLFADTKATTFVADGDAQARILIMAKAPETMSAVSFATSIAETSDDELPFPPVPNEAEQGLPFICPYCLHFQQFKRGNSEYQWRKHIFQDLEPYICTFSSCSLETYQSQHSWFEHELLVHRSRWVCTECVTSFRSSDDLTRHVNRDHRGLISDRQLSAFTNQSKRPIESISPTECPFCDDQWAQGAMASKPKDQDLVVDLDQFRRHLGRHMQQVALFSLPRLNSDHDNAEVPEQEVSPSDYRWVRDDCGHGWSVIARRRGTIMAFAAFKDLYDLQGRHPLVKASLVGDLERVRQLLDAGIDVNVQDDINGNALNAASRSGHEKVVDFLLAHGAEINSDTGAYGTALYGASMNGHTRVVRLLSENGANVNNKGQFGSKHALGAAAEGGHEQVVKILLEYGGEIDARGRYHRTALYAATFRGHEQIVRLLLAHGAKIEIDGKESVLPVAARSNNASIAKLLLDHGAIVDARDSQNESALRIAAFFGSPEVAKLLIDAGADVNAQDSHCISALHIAAGKSNTAVIQLLLDKGADIDIRDRDGCTPLHPAAFMGYRSTVKTLLDNGADVNVRDREGCTPLYQAAWRGHSSTVKLLLEYGADIDAEDHEGRTALHQAAFRGKSPTVKLLLEHKADVNTRDHEGCTALDQAATKGYYLTVELLLAYKADVNVQCENHGTALEAASSEGHEEIVRLLLGHRARRGPAEQIRLPKRAVVTGVDGTYSDDEPSTEFNNDSVEPATSTGSEEERRVVARSQQTL